MKVIREVSISNFESWSGAKDTQNKIILWSKENEFDTMIEELYPDGIEETQLNDILWHDSDWVYETLGIKEITASELFGQLSETGEPFDCGYYIQFLAGTYYYAEGEEADRDKFLADEGVFDEETPDWETLHEAYPDNYYHSEWFVEEGLDGGYDKEGDYYLNVDGEFIPEN